MRCACIAHPDAAQALVLRKLWRYRHHMSRPVIATVVGLLGFIAYVAIVLIVADSVLGLHWVIQAAFFVLAGSLWVIPIRWLMYWSVGRR